MSIIKIAIVDDHPLFLEGLNILLSAEKDIKIVGQANNGKEFIEKLSEIDPDIVLMDIEMPEMNGIETTKYLSENNPKIKVIALSMHGDEEFYYNMIHAGAKGFLLKESKSGELKEAIKKVNEGENYFAQELLRRIIYNFGGEKLAKTKKAPELSKRELEVLSNICNGLSNSEIADVMHISQRTAEGHRANLLKKTNSKNTASLIMYAIKNDLVQI